MTINQEYRRVGTHIKSCLDETLSFCGESITGSEFHFKTIEQAVLNGIHRTEALTCKGCVIAVNNALMRGLLAERGEK